MYGPDAEILYAGSVCILRIFAERNLSYVENKFGPDSERIGRKCFEKLSVCKVKLGRCVVQIVRKQCDANK